MVPDRLERSHFEAVTRYLREGDRQLDWEWVELPARHRDGHEFPVGISFGEYIHDGTHHFTGVLRDITEHKQRERELQRRNERLTDISRLVAHDLHRPLTTAENYLEAVDGDDEALLEAADALGRMDDVIADVLALVGRNEAVDARDASFGTVDE